MQERKAASVATTTSETKKPRGMKHFMRVVQSLNHEEFAPELDDEWRLLLAELRRVAKTVSTDVKGKLTLTVDVKITAKNELTLTGGVKRTAPSMKRAGSHYFLTDDGDVTADNPNQMSFPVRGLGRLPIAGADNVDDDADEA